MEVSTTVVLTVVLHHLLSLPALPLPKHTAAKPSVVRREPWYTRVFRTPVHTVVGHVVLWEHAF